jgi:hypothetical protein
MPTLRPLLVRQNVTSASAYRFSMYTDFHGATIALGADEKRARVCRTARSSGRRTASARSQVVVQVQLAQVLGAHVVRQAGRVDVHGSGP